MGKILDWILKEGSDQQTAESKQGKVGTLEWVLKQGSDELAAESKQGKGGIINWLLRQELDKFADMSAREGDLSGLRSRRWVHEFHKYEDAILYLDNLKLKYKTSMDHEMEVQLENGYRAAKDHFGRNKE